MQEKNPYGTILSLAGLMAGLQGSSLGQTLPAAAQIVRGQEQQQFQQAQAEQQRQMQMQQQQQMQAQMAAQQNALSQYALQAGNEGLSQLLSAGVNPQQALSLQQSLTPAPQEEFIRVKEGETLFEPSVDPQTGQRTLKPITGANTLTKEDRKIRSEVLKEGAEGAKDAGNLLRDLQQLEKAFVSFDEAAKPFLGAGDVITQLLPPAAIRASLNQKGKEAFDIIEKTKSRVFQEYLQTIPAGAARLERTVEQIQKAIPDVTQKPEARRIIIKGLKEIGAYKIAYDKYLKEWAKYNPRDMELGRSMGVSTLNNIELVDKNNRVKLPNVKTLVQQDLQNASSLDARPYDITDTESTVIQEINNPSMVPSKEELLAIIRQSEPDFEG